MLPDAVQRIDRAVAEQERDAAPDHHRGGHGAGQAADVVERHVADRDVVGRLGKVFGLRAGGGDDAGVGERRALGLAGRPRRVENHRRVPGGDRTGVRAEGRAVTGNTEVLPPVTACEARTAEEDEVADGGDARTETVEEGHEVEPPVLRAGHQHHRTGLVEHEVELALSVGHVQRDQGRPDLDRGEPGDEPFRRVGCSDRDAITSGDAELQQAPRDVVHRVLELGVRPCSLGTTEERDLAVE